MEYLKKMWNDLSVMVDNCKGNHFSRTYDNIIWNYFSKGEGWGVGLII